jgi:hypothetical protein
MRKWTVKGRVLARVLAEELREVRGDDEGTNPVYSTVKPSGMKDITDAANGDSPPPV